jgi:hypothetical protein
LEDIDELPVLISRESELAGEVRVLGRLHRKPRLGVKLEVRRHPMRRYSQRRNDSQRPRYSVQRSIGSANAVHSHPTFSLPESST